jgi:1-deoxy-D-xylulose-5-phosphate reductoisomerase
MTLPSPAFPRRIALLGSTGSIGRQTLDVVRAFPQHFRVVALAARQNMLLLAEQAREFAPDLVACSAEDSVALAQLDDLLPGALRGPEGLLAAASYPDADVLVVATSGVSSLRPTLAAIQAGKAVATANKEPLVIAGALVMGEAARHGTTVLPIDSEHSAIWQCLRGEAHDSIRRIIITASGGPFRTMPREAMASVTVEQALAHPTWRMGSKITIDSATLMNKGLEVIEAHWLFDVPYERVAVVVHPQSIIHSMVEFKDGSMKMQASLPTMHLPIQEALSHPVRLDGAEAHLLPDLDLARIGHLDFEPLDRERFPCFGLALDAARRGGTFPAVLVGADEVAVDLFLQGAIGLMEIPARIERVLADHEADAVAVPDLDDLLAAYEWARARCGEMASLA